jgi:cell cycle serine/threonine-protein kinase CDC5/MSD2
MLKLELKRMPADVPTPPAIIFNAKKNKQYHRMSALGQGGFAKCYKVVSEQQEYALKCVYKKSLKNPKHVDKLKSEIKIHSKLKNDRIVTCFSYFEDREFVYLVLELCHLKTLGNMLRVRHRLTEPETRYFMLQISDALDYLHQNHIIHRDLKLGNILLTKQMTIKLADFGLAAVVTNEERKKTLCGTPNYLAPEILHGTEHGHSYEVDIWSFGCVCYTLLFGKPPFQAKQVNDIYQKIKKVQFAFPENVPISEDAKYLINMCLQVQPDLRPSALDVQSFSFFKQFIPETLQPSALQAVPEFHRASSSVFDISSKIPVKKRRNTIQQFLHNLQECFHIAENYYHATHQSIPWPQQCDTIEPCNTLDNPFKHVLSSDLQPPMSFIVKWIDYSNKYGLSYELTNGMVGILFNDLSSMLLSPNEA